MIIDVRLQSSYNGSIEFFHLVVRLRVVCCRERVLDDQDSAYLKEKLVIEIFSFVSYKVSLGADSSVVIVVDRPFMRI